MDVIRTRFFKGQWKYEDANALHIIKIKKTSIMEKKLITVQNFRKFFSHDLKNQSNGTQNSVCKTRFKMVFEPRFKV